MLADTPKAPIWRRADLPAAVCFAIIAGMAGLIYAIYLWAEHWYVTNYIQQMFHGAPSHLEGRFWIVAIRLHEHWLRTIGFLVIAILGSIPQVLATPNRAVRPILFWLSRSTIIWSLLCIGAVVWSVLLHGRFLWQTAPP
jgi:hypothetical protein